MDEHGLGLCAHARLIRAREKPSIFYLGIGSMKLVGRHTTGRFFHVLFKNDVAIRPTKTKG